MKKILVLLICFVSFAGFAEFRVLELDFVINEITDLDTGVTKDSEEPDTWSGINFSRRYILDGEIFMHEFNENTLSHRHTAIRNVRAIYKFKGLDSNEIIDADQRADRPIMHIKGMKGNKLADLFDHQFYGGEFLYSLGAIIGIKPNYTFMFNKKKIYIKKVDFALDMFIGCASKLGATTMKFIKKSSMINENIEVSLDGNTGPQNVNVEMTVDEVLNRDLK